MEIAKCEHRVENTHTNTENGLTGAICYECGQRRTCIPGDDNSIVITKLGWIGNALVVPPGQYYRSVGGIAE